MLSNLRVVYSTPVLGKYFGKLPFYHLPLTLQPPCLNISKVSKTTTKKKISHQLHIHLKKWMKRFLNNFLDQYIHVVFLFIKIS